jgi:hypothetical protein
MVQFSFMNVLIQTHNQTHKYYPWLNVGKRNQIQYANYAFGHTVRFEHWLMHLCLLIGSFMHYWGVYYLGMFTLPWNNDFPLGKHIGISLGLLFAFLILQNLYGWMIEAIQAKSTIMGGFLGF